MSKKPSPETQIRTLKAQLNREQKEHAQTKGRLFNMGQEMRNLRNEIDALELDNDRLLEIAQLLRENRQQPKTARAQEDQDVFYALGSKTVSGEVLWYNANNQNRVVPLREAEHFESEEYARHHLKLIAELRPSLSVFCIQRYYYAEVVS